jgi:hypothetical protein
MHACDQSGFHEPGIGPDFHHPGFVTLGGMLYSLKL